MSTAKNAKIEIETGQSLSGASYSAMSDSGDHQIYTVSGGTLWSGKSGKAPTVRPNGIVSGRNLLSPGTSADYVAVAAFTAYSKGILKTVNATTISCDRASAGNLKIDSVTMTSAGTIAVVAGTEGSAFVSTRATAGGPPLIPVDSVELGQIYVTGSTAAVIETSEIYQVVGQHTERYDYPTWQEFNVGLGESAETSAEKYAHVKFDAALPLIHTGGIAKKAYIQYYTPQFTELTRAHGFRPVEQSHSVSSQEYYRGSIGSVSSSIGQGGFTALLNDGLTDSIVAEKDNTLTVRMYPDENKSAYSLTQGRIGLSRTFPFDNQVQAEVTISAERVTAEYAS